MAELKLTDFPIRAEFLEKSGVKAMVRTPRGANKSLPPPRTEVLVQAADEAAADALFAEFIQRSER